MDWSAIIENIADGAASVLVTGIFAYLGVILTLKFEKNKYNNDIKRENFKNKPEFRVSIANFENDNEADLAVLYSVYNIYFNENNQRVLSYNLELLDKNNLKYFDYELKNIGNSSIEYTEVVSHVHDYAAIMEIKHSEYIIKNNYTYSTPLFDKKILPKEALKLRVYHHKNIGPSPSLCTFVIIFQDENGTRYEQPFFENEINLYSPKIISREEYIATTRGK